VPIHLLPPWCRPFLFCSFSPFAHVLHELVPSLRLVCFSPSSSVRYVAASFFYHSEANVSAFSMAVEHVFEPLNTVPNTRSNLSRIALVLHSEARDR